MAKKVFIGVLAALMLFAFVACDGGTAASGTITMVEATTKRMSMLLLLIGPELRLMLRVLL